MTDLDIVVFGATGFTGALAAGYLADNAPPTVRWGVAGRSRDRLAAVCDRLGVEVPMIEADVADPASMRRLAESTRVLATTVGPYLRYGEPAVAACAAAGTDYLDLTGEAEFVDRMYLRHHERAVRSGARLVHACGFDSVPYDLGALFTVQHLPAGRPIRLHGYVAASGALSGGTVASAVNALARSRHAARAHGERRGVEPTPADRRARAVPSRLGRDRDVDGWIVPLPTIDPQIVARSARALDRYGPDFSYSHSWLAGGAARALAVSGTLITVFGLSKLPPTRALLRRLRPVGAGPGPDRRADGWFRVRFVGTAAPDARIVTEVRGGDPGYGETSKMLAESALCLACDALPRTAGQVTTAVAMGDALRVRLERAGIAFRVVER